MKVNGLAKALGKFFTKRGPEILLGVGIAGFATSIIFAVGATPKAIQLIEEAEAETVPEKIKASWTCYIPAAASFAGAVLCVIFSHKIIKKRHAALAAVYQITEATLQQYQQKVVDTIGEKKEKNMQDKINEDTISKIEETRPTTFIMNYDSDYPVIEGITGAVFPSSFNKVEKVENWLNFHLREENYVSFAELLYELGVPKDAMEGDLEYLDYIGWNITGGEVKFNKTYKNLKDGRPTFMITYSRRPDYNFDKFG